MAQLHSGLFEQGGSFFPIGARRCAEMVAHVLGHAEATDWETTAIAAEADGLIAELRRIEAREIAFAQREAFRRTHGIRLIRLVGKVLACAREQGVETDSQWEKLLAMQEKELDEIGPAGP